MRNRRLQDKILTVGSNRSTYLTILVLILIWIVLCSPWFLGYFLIPYDAKTQFYPWAGFIADSLRSGQLPFWNPYLHSGYPMVSDPQANTFSPLAVTLMTAVAEPSMRWFDMVELLHSLIGGIGVVLLGRYIGLSATATLVAALVFMFGGPAAARLQHTGIIYAYAYFPYALLFLKQTLDSGSYGRAMLFGLFGGIMALHGNQVAYIFSLTLIGYTLFRVLTADSMLRFLVRCSRPLLLGGAVGALVLLPQLLATWTYLPFTNRPSIPFEVAAQQSLSPLTLLTAVVPNFFGSLWGRPSWPPGDITTTYLYIGSIPVVLIAYYGLWRDRGTGSRIKQPKRN